MSLQPNSNSQQVVSDLIQRLRHAFSEEADSADVSFTEFKLILNKVFSNASDVKLEQIFVSFDEESKGTINWYHFLKNEQLSRVLLSLHDDSISQISLLQRDSYDTTGGDSKDSHDTSEISFADMVSTAIGAQSIPMEAAQRQNDWRRITTAPPKQFKNNHANQSYESITSLEQEVQEKHEEIAKLKEWITEKGLPASKTLHQFEQKANKQNQREIELVEEMKRLQNANESLKARNITLHKEYNVLESQHSALKNEHMSFKVLCNEIQRKYDECLELYKREKDQITNLMTVNDNLNKLNDQYERVNDDQNAKIASEKEKTEDLRDKCGIFEMYIAEIVAENENLHQILKESENSDPAQDSTVKGRSRTLSAVNENSESKTPKLKGLTVDAKADKLPKHPQFQPSQSFQLNTSNFEDIVRRYSTTSTGSTGGRNRRGSNLLTRIRSQKSVVSPGVNDNDPYYQMHAAADSIMTDESGSFRQRRKRTVSILSIGGMGLITPQGKGLMTLRDSIGTSGGFDGMYMDADDDTNRGYADAAYDEFGDMDDLDQLAEITDQLRIEIQEEMEEELEKQIQNKYDLKFLKLKTSHNEQLMLLNVEIDRLRTINKRQVRQLKSAGAADDALNYVDDQKTNEAEEMNKKLDDDMDDLENLSMEDDDSDETYSSRSVSSEEADFMATVRHYEDEDDNKPLLDDEDSMRPKKHNKHKKKKHKKKKKKQKLVDKRATKELENGRFCCSSIWKDYNKYEGDENIASTASEGKSSKKYKEKKKKKKKKKKDKEKKKHKSKHKKKKKKKKKKHEDERERRSNKRTLV